MQNHDDADRTRKHHAEGPRPRGGIVQRNTARLEGAVEGSSPPEQGAPTRLSDRCGGVKEWVVRFGRCWFPATKRRSTPGFWLSAREGFGRLLVERAGRFARFPRSPRPVRRCCSATEASLNRARCLVPRPSVTGLRGTTVITGTCGRRFQRRPFACGGVQRDGRACLWRRRIRSGQ